MFRLWNLLDGRCTFKKKLGLDEEDENRIAFKVKWEPTKGEVYAILYDKKVDILTVNSDEPINTVSSDTNLMNMEFLGEDKLIITDE
jgi:hypothetical protein